MRTEAFPDLISIIVPVYNMEAYLERCMASIQGQTYENLEIILVDDGSTDRSGQMCDAYAQADARVKVVHKPNGGLSDARNAGLAVAAGVYIGYVDSDDWIEPDMYERMYRACTETGSQLAACRYFSERGGAADVEKGSGAVVPLSREALLKIYICGHEQYMIYNSVWSKLFHRDLVEDMRFPMGRNSEDIMYTTRAFCRLSKAVYLDTGLYHYVIDREGSIMNAAGGERMFRDEIPFWREHIACIRENVSNAMGDLAAYYFWRRMLSYYLVLYSGRETRKDARRLAEIIRRGKDEIKTVYAAAGACRGDRVRMAVFQVKPVWYYGINACYERYVIPVKRKRGRRGQG